MSHSTSAVSASCDPADPAPLCDIPQSVGSSLSVRSTEAKGRGVFTTEPIPRRTHIHTSPVLIFDSKQYEEHGKFTVLEHYGASLPPQHTLSSPQTSVTIYSLLSELRKKKRLQLLSVHILNKIHVTAFQLPYSVQMVPWRRGPPPWLRQHLQPFIGSQHWLHAGPAQ